MPRRFRALVPGAFVLSLCVAMPAIAQEKSAVRAGFALAPGGGARILLFRPGIKVGAQSTGGLFEPNADWTAQARGNIEAALGTAQGRLGNRVIPITEPAGAPAQTLADYRALFAVVAQAVITYQFFPGNRLPTKKHGAPFDWTLGPGVAAIPGADRADYGLFIVTDDEYGSTGRKVFQVMAAVGGVGIQSGQHTGYAGLVDLRSGDLVWLNADNRMGGDVRSADGAGKRVAQLLAGFPGSASDAAPAGTAR